MLQARAALLYTEKNGALRSTPGCPAGDFGAARGSAACGAQDVWRASDGGGMCGVALLSERAGWKEWWATVKAAARRLATRRLEERLSLALFRVSAPAAVWLRRWVLDMPATREAPLDFIVSLPGGCCRLLPVTCLVWFAHGGHKRPHFCDFCLNRLVGDADAPRILFVCPSWIQWVRRWPADVDLAFSRTPVACGASAWWLRFRREPPSHALVTAALTAAGCPQIH